MDVTKGSADLSRQEHQSRTISGGKRSHPSTLLGQAGLRTFHFPTIALLGCTEARVAVRGFPFLSFNFTSYTARIDPCNAKAYHQ
jgi:hypothetical protein